MSSQNEGEICDFCGRRFVIKRDQQVAFRQRTDKGYVLCRVTIPISICSECGVAALDFRMAEAIMDEAVHREYSKLP